MSADEQIRAARAAINRAIADRDVAGIVAYLRPEYDIVTARSDHRHGRDASAKSWTDLFARDPVAIYIRTPDQIHVSGDGAMAQELGTWTGTLTGRTLSGVYAAKWQLTEEGWQLEAEIFTPL